ncbi:ABC-type glycerol-3-phosphate transport system, permease component [Paenibacillus sp. UNCCL117]|uniref:carbohydrate ABC transporter permease n=1 Tax=unclassified Paenibacillus TaxID=185978 RepID=UPI00088F489F|nr:MULTISPECIES: carbohydrate ABC transporter permease [unclassified Paenibacillus]SDE19825.1 ABC-type glycerol-3-phosphate transport system, permease component [Paenibacillus sp. cl123]SFW61931.1 ABC-type glycerol-3-phosphate transport system, permease component [Paenibacillus sp. UNCCL117]
MNEQALQTNPSSFRLLKLVGQVVMWAFLLVTALLTLFPVLMTLSGSLKSNAELMSGGGLLPEVWRFANYAEAWKQTNFAQYTWNSLFLSVMVTAGTLLVAAMAAYVVDRRSFPGKALFVGIQASTMFISVGAVVLRPQFDLMVKLHLNTTLWGVILILISAHASTFFILLGFFKAIPRDLDEAAMMDGSSFTRSFFTIILPLLAPGLGVSGLFAFRHAWNEYILPLVFTMTNPKLQTLTVGLANLRYGSSAAMQVHLMMAGACLSILPMLIVYILANKSFMQVTAGSVKG